MRIYVGATFSRYEEVRAINDMLIAAGHEITHDWTRTDQFGDDGHPLPEFGGGYVIPPAVAVLAAEEDRDAVKRADLLLMLGQQASCGWPVETGMGIAWGKEIWLVAPFKYTVFWDLPNVETFGTLDQPFQRLGVTVAA